MKTQLIVLTFLCFSAAGRLVRLTGSNHCACSELTQQTDCQALGCTWVTINGSSSCSAATVTSTNTCSNYTTQQSCDAQTGCAWTNADACAAFTKCSDYTITSTANANQCYLKDPTCVPGTASGTSVPCTTGTVTCTNVDQTVCNSVQQSTTTLCWWSTSCIAQDISKCSTITDSTLCTGQGCTYASGKCAAPTCAGTAEADCKYVRDDTQGQVQICTWANNACANANDTTALNATTCYSNTAGTYRWDGSACSACSGQSSSNAFLLAFFALLAMLMF